MAHTARGPELRRMMFASDRQSPIDALPLDKRDAAPIMLTWFPARSTAPRSRDATSATGPFQRCPPDRPWAMDGARHRWPTEPGLPAAGDPAGATARNADGATLVTASPQTPPHVTASSRGLPPAWLETFSGPSGGGSMSMMARGAGVGKSREIFLVSGDCSAPLPLGGGESKINALAVG